MTVTNHALTGILIATVVSNPVVAAILSFFSHFALDSMPQFGGVDWYNSWNKKTALVAISDSLIMIAILTWTYFALPDFNQKAVLCGLISTLPDWSWGLYYLNITKSDLLFKFHLEIQRYERPWGIYFEILYGIVAITILVFLSQFKYT
jgi:hypothetical protein